MRIAIAMTTTKDIAKDIAIVIPNFLKQALLYKIVYYMMLRYAA
jgi:hypothetical protein